jgi:hypothetical protein
LKAAATKFFIGFAPHARRTTGSRFSMAGLHISASPYTLLSSFSRITASLITLRDLLFTVRHVTSDTLSLYYFDEVSITISDIDYEIRLKMRCYLRHH